METVYPLNKNFKVDIKIVRLWYKPRKWWRFVADLLTNCIKVATNWSHAFHPPFVILSWQANKSGSTWSMGFQIDCPELLSVKKTPDQIYQIFHLNCKFLQNSGSWANSARVLATFEMSLPVVEQLYCGYCVKAMALSRPSLSISSIASSVKGWTYRNPI